MQLPKPTSRGSANAGRCWLDTTTSSTRWPSRSLKAEMCVAWYSLSWEDSYSRWILSPTVLVPVGWLDVRFHVAHFILYTTKLITMMESCTCISISFQANCFCFPLIATNVCVWWWSYGDSTVDGKCGRPHPSEAGRWQSRQWPRQVVEIWRSAPWRLMDPTGRSEVN